MNYSTAGVVIIRCIEKNNKVDSFYQNNFQTDETDKNETIQEVEENVKLHYLGVSKQDTKSKSYSRKKW